MAIGRLGSVAGPLAAGQILAAGGGTTAVLLATSPGLVVATLAVLSVIRYSAGPRLRATNPVVENS